MAHTDVSISDIFLWNEYNLLWLYSSTRTVKSASRKAQPGEMVFFKLYALLNKSEGILQNQNSELLGDVDYIKTF